MGNVVGKSFGIDEMFFRKVEPSFVSSFSVLIWGEADLRSEEGVYQVSLIFALSRLLGVCGSSILIASTFEI